MNALIQIHYISNDNKVLQRGTFALKGKKSEEVAFDFWKWIKRKNYYECEIEKVIAGGEDITELVKELEKAPLE